MPTVDVVINYLVLVLCLYVFASFVIDLVLNTVVVLRSNAAKKRQEKIALETKLVHPQVVVGHMHNGDAWPYNPSKPWVMKNKNCIGYNSRIHYPVSNQPTVKIDEEI